MSTKFLQVQVRGNSLAVTGSEGEHALALGPSITLGIIGFLQGIEQSVPLRQSPGKVRSIELRFVSGGILLVDVTDGGKRFFSTRSQSLPLIINGQGVVSFSTSDDRVMGVPPEGLGGPGPSTGSYIRQ